MVNKYISEFLHSIENFVFSKILNKIYLMIIDGDKNNILEIFNLDLSFPYKIYEELNYDELCLNFKSILFKMYLSAKNFYNNNSNSNIEISGNKSRNKTFVLCIDTKEDKVVTNSNLYENIFTTIEEKFLKNLFQNDLLNLFKKREIIADLEHLNFSICVSRNYV